MKTVSKDFNKGSYVLINTDITRTKKFYSSTSDMRNMAGDGKLYKISDVEKIKVLSEDKYEHRIRLRISGFAWDSEDVHFPEAVNTHRNKTFNFDYTQLDLDENLS